MIITSLSATAITDFTMILVYSILITPIVLLLCFYWPTKWQTRIKMPHNAITVTVSLALIVSVAATEWPLRLSYAYAKPGLNALASKVEKNQKIDLPVQLGLIRIVKVDISPSEVVCLWTDLNPGGRTGFVKTRSEYVESQFNIWWTRSMDNDWQFISED